MFEGLKVSATWLDQNERNSDVWRMTISRDGKSIRVPFSQGSAFKGKPPTLDTVMECLVSDANGGMEDFEEFCGNFGYDTDSRDAHKTWKACKSIADRLPKVITSEEWEAINEGNSETFAALKAIPTKNN